MHGTSPQTVVSASSNTSGSPSTTPHKATMASNLKLLILLLSKVPLLMRVAILHVLGLSEPAKYIDLRSHLVVSLVRSIMAPAKPRPISFTQNLTTRNTEIKGKIWVSLYTSPSPPETGVRDVLLEALQSMNSHTSGTKMRLPELSHVEAEWTGYRSLALSDEPLPITSEWDKYHEMMKECQKPTTVLYFHGGAYYLCDPATHRPTVKKLAKLTGGRCYSVRYRLAPQHPFPSALLDAFISYLTLLYPPLGAYHLPVKPENIVFAGDSAGGNLALALLQLILQVRRLNSHVQWYGESREIPLPAGVACVSPWIDITQSSPSWLGDDPHQFDYLPKPQAAAEAPPCDIWPANPPRKYLYADNDLVAHPLSSLIMSRSWEGSPPIWMCTGWELLAYEDKALAMKLVADGVPLVFEEYEAMPHCFALFLSKLPNSKRCFDSWGAFIRHTIDDPSSIKASAVTIKARTLNEVQISFDKLLDDRLEDIQSSIVKKAELTEGERGAMAKL